MYISPYNAYPFLSDPSEDLRCDFEILTDKISSMTGLLASMTEGALKAELLQVDALIYHLNPSLRTFFSIENKEIAWLKQKVDAYNALTQDRCNTFVLPQGSKRACLAHVLRTECKTLVRLTYRYIEKKNDVDHAMLDFINLLSGYFFMLALYLNKIDDTDEVPFVSRNYK